MAKSINAICKQIESKIRAYENNHQYLCQEYHKEGKTERQQANIDKQMQENERLKLEWIHILNDLQTHIEPTL